MKNVFFKKVFTHAAVYFSAFMTFYLMIMLFSYVTGGFANAATAYDVVPAPVPVLALALVFCLSVAFANCFYASDKMKPWIKLTVHFIITIMGFFLFIYMPQSKINSYKPATALIVGAMAILLYFIIFVIYRLVKRKTSAKKNKISDYKPVYKK